MLLFLYLVVLADNLGLFSVAPLFEIASPLGRFYASDVLLIVLLVATAPAYLRQRAAIDSRWLRRAELAWIVFIAILAVQSFRSPADSLTERFVNLRFVEGYLLFFPSVAMLTTVRRIRTVAGAVLLFSIAGTLLTLLQSAYGLERLFDSPFYAIGDWYGNRQYVGSITRVNLPISDLIALVVVVLLALTALEFRLSVLALCAFLSLTILTNFARSLWLAMVASLLLEFAILKWFGAVRVGRAIVVVSLIPACLLASVLMAQLFGFGGISEALWLRLDEGIYYYTGSAGTWEARMDQASGAMDLWQDDRLFGFGISYYFDFVDIGFPATLASTGVTGLGVLSYLLGVCSLAGLAVVREGARRGSHLMTAVGLSVPAQAALMLVYQHWLTPRSWTIVALASAMAFASVSVSTAEETETVGSETPGNGEEWSIAS